MRRIILIMVLVMVFSLGGVRSSVFALSSKYYVATLKGINNLNVIVEDLRPDFRQAGLSESQIQTDVELKLRLAGIKVITEKESFKEKGMPYLYVRINTSKSSYYFFCFSLNLELRQDVFLERNRNIKIPVATWSVGDIGSGDIKYIREVLKDEVDQFINAYFSVNPKN